MIVDTSAIVAIALGEPDADVLEDLLLRAENPRMSAATYVELCAVMQRRGRPELVRQVNRLLEAYGVRIEPFDESQARVAAHAYADFGRGSGHPAGLNLGDTFSYALASVLDEPLLFRGGDFVHTDIRSAAD